MTAPLVLLTSKDYHLMRQALNMYLNQHEDAQSGHCVCEACYVARQTVIQVPQVPAPIFMPHTLKLLVGGDE